eukprot:11247251-Alexandrium_andersonii.AAC.1
MSASLVGSEMCIRDSPGEEGGESPSPIRPGKRGRLPWDTHRCNSRDLGECVKCPENPRV